MDLEYFILFFIVMAYMKPLMSKVRKLFKSFGSGRKKELLHGYVLEIAMKEVNDEKRKVSKLKKKYKFGLEEVREEKQSLSELKKYLQAAVDEVMEEKQAAIEEVIARMQAVVEEAMDEKQTVANLKKDLEAAIEEAMDEKQTVANLKKDLEAAMEEVMKANLNTLDWKKKYEASREDAACTRRVYESSLRECLDLQKMNTWLENSCSEKEKTIDGLQEALSNNLGKDEKELVDKLHMEHIRLTEAEQDSRRESDSLRRENIDVIRRLIAAAGESGVSTLKLDQELWDRVSCLGNDGMMLLHESIRLCSDLLEFVKGNIYCVMDGLDQQCVVEFETKAEIFRRKIVSLGSSLDTVSVVLQEKQNLGAQSQPRNSEIDEEAHLRSELKAEVLATNLLREMLYSKDVEIELLKTELNTIVRGRDIHYYSDVNYRRELELRRELQRQAVSKDESIHQMQIKLQKYDNEMSLMCEKVKHCEEKDALTIVQINKMKEYCMQLENVLVNEGRLERLIEVLPEKNCFAFSLEETPRIF